MVSTWTSSHPQLTRGPTRRVGTVNLFPWSAVTVLSLVDGGGYVHGDLHRRPEHPVNESKVSGTVHDLDPNTTFPSVDAGSAATNNDNATIPLTDDGENALNGGDFSLGSNDGIDLLPGTYYFSSIDTKPGSELRVVGPTAVYVTGSVVIKGSLNNTTLNPANFQLLVLGNYVEITAQADVHAAVYAPEAEVVLRGGADVHGMVIGDELDIAGDVQVYVDQSLEDLAETLIPLPQSSPSPPSTWTPVANGVLEIDDSMITGNQYGLRQLTGQSLVSSDTDYSNNAEWGLYIKGSFDLDGCTVSDNAVGGIWLDQIQDGDFSYADVTVSDNSQCGLYLQNCNVTFDATMLPTNAISGSARALTVAGGSLAATGLTINGASVAGIDVQNGTLAVANSTLSGNAYGISSSNSAVTLHTVTLTGNSTCGVHITGGTLAADGSVASGGVDGISADSCTSVTLDTCTLSGNSVGLLASRNTSLVVTGSTFTGNTVWGSAVEPSGGSGVSVTFDSCAIQGNAGGLSVSSATDGDVKLQGGTVISDNTSTGLHFESCNLTVNDQLAGTAWSSLRNHYGISGTGSSLVLDGVVVSDSTAYALHTTNCALTVRNSNLTGRNGIYVVNNSSSTVDATRLTATASGVTSWGIYRQEGDLLVRNCVINGFENGIYLETGSSHTATVVNNTIANVGTYGIYIADGPARVENTIVVGNNAQYGIVDDGAQLTHSYNLIHGVANAFSGATPATGEIFKTPRFADAAAGDFSLGPGSPAINAGLDQSIDVPTDIVGNARPLFHAFDMGAYEYPDDNASFRVLDWTERR